MAGPEHRSTAAHIPNWRVIAALLVGVITAVLDTTIVAIGLRTMQRELHTSVATIQWVSTGYLLALAVAIPFVSWAQARFGGKRLWLFALGLFLLGSILCSSDWDVESLITFRIIQGLGGGVMFPLMTTLAMQRVEPAAMARTMATVSVPIALGPILGPVLGGSVLNWLDWRWLFLINVPIAIVGLALALAFLPTDTAAAHTPRRRLDIVGVVLIVPALLGLLYGLSLSNSSGGFGNAQVWAPVSIGIVFLAAFVAWASRLGSAALIDIRLLRVRSVRASSVALIFLGGTLYASSFLLPLYFQTLRGEAVLAAGLLMIPQSAGSLLARSFTGRLVDRLGSKVVALVGFIVIATATIPFALADAHANLWYLGVTLFIRGLGLGTVVTPVMAVAYLDIPRTDMSHASAITRIVQQLGGAFGTALVAVTLQSELTAGHPVSGFNFSFWCTIAITAMAAVAGIALPGRGSAKPSTANTPIAPSPPATKSRSSNLAG
jgi:EmrB/QacA subfamily drug resistance transporter